MEIIYDHRCIRFVTSRVKLNETKCHRSVSGSSVSIFSDFTTFVSNYDRFGLRVNVVFSTAKRSAYHMPRVII